MEDDIKRMIDKCVKCTERCTVIRVILGDAAENVFPFWNAQEAQILQIKQECPRIKEEEERRKKYAELWEATRKITFTDSTTTTSWNIPSYRYHYTTTY